MERMSPADAKAYLNEVNDLWDMPQKYWNVETATVTFHVDLSVVIAICDNRCPMRAGFIVFKDIYGADCYLNPTAITAMFESSKTIRARWITGLDTRNYREDEPGDEPWQK